MTGLAWIEARRREWASRQSAYRRWCGLTPGKRLDSGIVWHGGPPSLATHIRRCLNYKPTAREKAFETLAAWNRSADVWKAADGRILSPSDFGDAHLFRVLRMLHTWCERHSIPRPLIYDRLQAEARVRGLRGWAPRRWSL